MAYGDLFDDDDERETLDVVNPETAEALAAIVGRIEALNNQAVKISDETKAEYAGAKAAGFDTKVLRALIKLRADPESHAELEELLRTYREAVDSAQKSAHS